ncbi:MAG: RNA recognition motif domain-containing protein [Bacteroidales bacterium]
MNIYVGNLDYEVSEEKLEELFGGHGAVNSAKIIFDKFSGRSKGFGFIVMDDEMEAKEAIEHLNGTALNDRTIVVNEAKPKKRFT